jgi:hypothetical protein
LINLKTMSNSTKQKQFTRLEEEEVKIEISEDQSNIASRSLSNSIIQLIFRSPSNNDTKLLIDKNKITTMLELRMEV